MSDSAHKKHKWTSWLAVALFGVFFYASSYLVLGRHQSGESALPRYTYHDRDFSFDPWIFFPLAKLECEWRGRDGADVQVVIDGSPGRDGSASYIFWSGEPKF